MAEPIYAFEGARAVPASLSPDQYRALPEWQQSFRTPDKDHDVAQFLRALGGGERALITKGESVSGAPFDGTAGELVPLALSDYVSATLWHNNRMRMLSRVFPYSPSLRIGRQGNSEPSLGSYWIAEGDTILRIEPEIDDVIPLQLKTLKALSAVSNEILEDAGTLLVNWLVGDVVGAMAYEEERRMVSQGFGNAVQPASFEGQASIPVGVAPSTGPYVPTSPTQDAVARTATLIDFTHLSKMYDHLRPEARKNAVWICSPTVFNYVMGISGHEGWKIYDMVEIDLPAGLGRHPVPHVLGSPMFSLPAIETSDTPTAQSENRLYLADMVNSYMILDGGMRIERSTQGASFGEDKTEFRFVLRSDGRGTMPVSLGFDYVPGFVFTGMIDGPGTPV